MKQTFGRVSKWGCVPLGYSLDGINPMARTAYDCALMLSVMAGYDPKDPCTVDVPVPDYTALLDGSVAGMRIGVATKYFFDRPQLDPETAESVLAERIPGDFIETGVWRGGACILLRAVLEAWNVRDRRVFVADSFMGLPPPDP